MYRCEACAWEGRGRGAAIGHESRRHDGAQTCWTEEERRGRPVWVPGTARRANGRLIRVKGHWRP